MATAKKSRKSTVPNIWNDVRLDLSKLTEVEPGVFDYEGDIEFGEDCAEKIPVKFRKVIGNFTCQESGLISLENAPDEVTGNFNCSSCSFKSLKGAPSVVGGDFDCAGNNLTTLEGSPRTVGGSFWCNDNRLKTLKGMPKAVNGDFNCSNNLRLKLFGTVEGTVIR